MNRLAELVIAGVLIGLASVGGALYLHKRYLSKMSVAERCVLWTDKVCQPGNELCTIGAYILCRQYDGDTDKLEQDLKARSGQQQQQ